MKDPKKFKCPKCRAPIGQPCRSKNHQGGYSGVRPHKERMQSGETIGPCQCCGNVTPLICGPSRFGEETWACVECWNPDERASAAVKGK
jgi:hypothetical protein